MYLIVLEFAKWLQTTRNYSKSTIETYIRALESLDDYVKDIIDKYITENEFIIG